MFTNFYALNSINSYNSCLNISINLLLYFKKFNQTSISKDIQNKYVNGYQQVLGV